MKLRVLKKQESRIKYLARLKEKRDAYYSENKWYPRRIGTGIYKTWQAFSAFDRIRNSKSLLDQKRRRKFYIAQDRFQNAARETIGFIYQWQVRKDGKWENC